MTTTERQDTTRQPFYRNVGFLRVIGQIGAILVVVLILAWLINNLITNMNRLGISTSFDFLFGPTNFQIPYHEEFDPRSPVWEMVLVGVKNTFLAGFFGIIIASIVGLVVGVSRLSDNWLVARLV